MDEREIRTRLEEALAKHQSGQLADAIAAYQRVLDAQPDNADALHLLGLARHQSGDADTDGIVGQIERAIELNPSSADFQNNLAGVLAARGMLPGAAAALRRAAALRPADPVLWRRLAKWLRDLGRFPEAADAYRTALALQPDAHGLAVNLGVTLLDMNEPADAVAVFENVLRQVPDPAEALANLGLALARLGRHVDAVSRYREALALRPDLPELHTNLGAALLALGWPQDAADAHRKALELRPGWTPAQSNLAIALAQLGRTDDALALHEQVLSEHPGDATSLFNRGVIRLSRGDFAGGWPDYEARFRVPELRGQQTFPQPRWEGQDAEGKTILVHAEQGLGDTIQFARYLPRILARGARVVLQCDPLLVRLMRHSFPDVHIVARGEPLPPFDLHEPIMSLPYAFGTLRATIPADVPYLTVPPEASSGLPDEQNAGDGPLRVGLVWSGNPGHYNDRNRSIPLAALLGALKAVPGVRLFSLQKRPGAEQLPPLASEFNVTDVAASFADLADSAAAIRRMDVTICVDTSIAHLAGALGAMVWTLLPEPADFRWLIGRDDSPWYPTMRLFRQAEPGNWEPVLSRLATELSTFRRSYGRTTTTRSREDSHEGNLG